MKNKYRIFYIFMFLPLLMVLLSLPFLPDKIPAHYNAAGNITRWGSKYENLLFPVITIGLGCFLDIITGNFLLKAKTNQISGVRLPGSINDEKAWFHNQRTGGIVLIAHGIIIIVGSLFFLKEETALFSQLFA